jgi:hypothetical protein
VPSNPSKPMPRAFDSNTSGITPELVKAASKLMQVKASIKSTAAAIAKLMGFRVEPTAVEQMLSQNPSPTNPYDVAFALTGARRLSDKASTGRSFSEAASAEQSYNVQHEAANKVRAEAIVAAKQQKSLTGPLVGWYAHSDVKTSPACRLANGHNFDALRGTLIGYPGSVHPHCRCEVGPPHPDGQFVDDVIQANPPKEGI